MQRIKQIFTSTMFLFMATMVNGQDVLPQGQQDFYCSGRIQALAGPNFSNQTSGYEFGESSSDSKPGVSAGIGLYSEIGSKALFMPALMYETKGSKTSYMSYDDDTGNPGNGSEYSDKVNLNYISVPIQFGLAPFGEKRTVFFNAGFTPALLVSANNKSESPSGDQETDIKDSYNSFDLALNGGVGIRAGERLFVKANYDHGITNVSEADALETKNKTIKLQVAYNLNFNPFFKESWGKGKGKKK